LRAEDELRDESRQDDQHGQRISADLQKEKLSVRQRAEERGAKAGPGREMQPKSGAEITPGSQKAWGRVSRDVLGLAPPVIQALLSCSQSVPWHPPPIRAGWQPWPCRADPLRCRSGAHGPWWPVSQGWCSATSLTGSGG